MRVLTITNMWPVSHKPHYGIFVQEQVEALVRITNIANTVFFLRGYKGIWMYFTGIFLLCWHLICRKAYDIIHIHSGICLLISVPWLFFFNKKVVVTLHGSDILRLPSPLVELIKFLAKRCHSIIVVNNMMMSFFIGGSANVYCIPCAVRDDFFYEKKEKHRIFNDLVLGFPSSRSVPVKNFKFFFEVVEALRCNYGFNVRYVEFFGMSRNDVRRNLNSITCLVMTSYSEGSPQIIKEAMCCNTPIVTKDVGNVAEMLDGVKNAIVISDYNVNYFCNAIIGIDKKDGLYTGREAIYRLGYDESSTTQKVYEVYKTICQT